MLQFIVIQTKESRYLARIDTSYYCPVWGFNRIIRKLERGGL